MAGRIRSVEHQHKRGDEISYVMADYTNVNGPIRPTRSPIVCCLLVRELHYCALLLMPKGMHGMYNHQGYSIEMREHTPQPHVDIPPAERKRKKEERKHREKKIDKKEPRTKGAKSSSLCLLRKG